MLTATSYKTKQFLLALIKLSLVLAAFYLIYTKLFQNKDFSFAEFSMNLGHLSSISIFTLLILLGLSIFNWFFEVLKWQTLVSAIMEIPLKEATSQTLGALTASLLTPNRIGDYGAKAMYFIPHYRKKIMFLNFVGNSVQMGITTIFGSVGLIYFSFQFQPQLNYNGIFVGIAAFGIISLGGILTMKLEWLKTQKKIIYRGFNLIKISSKNILLKVTLYALGRYVLFSFQFYFLLVLFGIDLGYLQGMVAVSTMYLLSSVLPFIFILDVLVKGGVAIYVFGLFGVPEFVILSIVTSMWILNFVLPSVMGSYHVLRFKLPKTAP